MRSVFSRLFLLLAALVIAASVLPAFAEEEAQAPSEPAPAAEAAATTTRKATGK